MIRGATPSKLKMNILLLLFIFRYSAAAILFTSGRALTNNTYYSLIVRAKPWNTTAIEERTTTGPFEPTDESYAPYKEAATLPTRVAPTAVEDQPFEPLIPHEIHSSGSPVESQESYERMFNDRKPSMEFGQNESHAPMVAGKVLLCMLIVGFASLTVYIGVALMKKKRKRSTDSVTTAVQQLQIDDSYSKGGAKRVRTTIVGEGDLEADGSGTLGKSNSIQIDKSFVIDDYDENCVSNGSDSANEQTSTEDSAGPEIV